MQHREITCVVELHTINCQQKHTKTLTELNTVAIMFKKAANHKKKLLLLLSARRQQHRSGYIALLITEHWRTNTRHGKPAPRSKHTPSLLYKPVS
jgi:hypothetical protein